MRPIDDVLRAARELRPDLWARTEAVAKIIAPEAFMDDWVVEPESGARLLAAKLAYLRAVAMRKAQDILEYLGVNTEADWMEILSRIAEQKIEAPSEFGPKKLASIPVTMRPPVVRPAFYLAEDEDGNLYSRDR